MEYRFWFGKYKGQRVWDIIAKDPKYIDWCYDHVKFFRMSSAEREFLHKCLTKFDNAEHEHCQYRPPMKRNLDDTRYEVPKQPWEEEGIGGFEAHFRRSHSFDGGGMASESDGFDCEDDWQAYLGWKREHHPGDEGLSL